MLKKLHIWLCKQPLLLPFTSLSLAIFAIDNDLVSTARNVSFILCILVAAWTSRKILFLSILSSITGALLHHQALQSQRDAASLHNQTVEIYSVVDSPPRVTPDRPTEAIIKILQGPEKLIGTKALARIPETYPVHIGKTIWLKGTITLPKPPLNPNVFDKPEFLHRQGVAIIFKADQAIPTSNTAITHKLKAFADSSKKYIRKKLTSGIEDSNAAKIILAMFLGEKPDSQSEILTDFKLSGAIHVFAVSGLHVMMIGLIFSLALKLCRLPTQIWIPIVIAIMFFYAIVTGMRPPAMRASIMGAVVLSSILLLRKPSLPNCLWLSGIIALLLHPHTLFLPGFQLSYAVLISIAFTASWWMYRYRWLYYIDPFLPTSLLTRKQKSWLHLRKKSSDTLAVSTSAWAGSSFLIWIYFGLITPLAILVSLPLMFIVFVLLSTCCISLTLGSISPVLGNSINKLNAHTANAAHTITRFFASIPHSRYHAQPWSTGERIIIYQLPDGGGASYLSLGGGILLDAGNAQQFRSQVLPSLTRNGARMDSLIASHPDKHHLQGLTLALQTFPIKQLIIPHGDYRSPSYTQLIQAATEKNIRIISSAETTFPVADGISLELIHAPSSKLPLADDRCLIFMLHWHGKRILFLNDSGHHLTHWLRQRLHSTTLEKLQSDVIVLGKHTTNESLHPDIISQLAPRTIIATHAYYPTSEARAPDWINAIKQQGIQLYLLSDTGAVTITQDQDKKQLLLETELN